MLLELVEGGERGGTVVLRASVGEGRKGRGVERDERDIAYRVASFSFIFFFLEDSDGRGRLWGDRVIRR